MTDKIILWYGEHSYYGWYSPSCDWIFLNAELINENSVEYILNHEVLHRVLNNFVNYEACFKLDNISLSLWLIEHDRLEFN